MKSILVVECISTGLNFIEDIIHRGYNPVALSVRVGDGAQAYSKLAEDSLKRIPYSFDRIVEQDTYEKTLELVKSYNPIVIVPGSEGGVVLANRLAHDLGLKGNPMEKLDAMTKKNAMQEALKDAGLRYIRGMVVHSVEEAKEFCEANGLNTAVVKPLESAGSMGVTLCNDTEEVYEAVKTLLSSEDIYGRQIETCLIQERIVGTEYIVNTISCNGKHRLSSIFRYAKVRTAEGGYIYNYAEAVESIEPGLSDLVRYALNTVSAIGFKYGEVHGEYMVDNKGPVLIEVNCRPMGNSYPADYLNRCFGQHETDSILDAYLDPVKFDEDAAKPYKTYCGLCSKLLMVPKDMEAESIPLRVIAENLRSTYMVAAAEDNTYTDFVKTVDLESNGGEVYMIHEDREILRHDLELLCEIEKKYFGFLISDGTNHRLVPYMDGSEENPVEIIKSYKCHGATLLVADKKYEIDNVLSVLPNERSKVGTGFDNVVISLGRYFMEHNDSENIRLAFELMKLVKKGGRVIISEETCAYSSYGRQGAELMLQVLGIEEEFIMDGTSGKSVVGRA